MTALARRITACLALAAGTAFAGPLNPPGPGITSTFKTLNDIEPRVLIGTTAATPSAVTTGDATAVYVINVSGSYYLSGNIAVPAGKAGIRIDASRVTLDLKGFAILCNNTGVDGVRIGAGAQSVRIMNGNIDLATHNAIDASAAARVTIEDITVGSSGGDAITAGGQSAIRRCQLTFVGTNAIRTGPSSIVEGCTVESAGGVGVMVGDTSVVRDCSVNLASLGGIATGVGGVVSNCTVQKCGVAGLLVGVNGRITGCTAVTTTGVGIQTGLESIVQSCIVRDSSTTGLVASSRTSVLDCNISTSTAFDVDVSTDCVVRGNTLTGYYAQGVAGGGVKVNGRGNIIQANHITRHYRSGDRGISLLSTESCVIGNTFSDNYFDIGGNTLVTDNSIGPIVGYSAMATTTNPAANYRMSH